MSKVISADVNLIAQISILGLLATCTAAHGADPPVTNISFGDERVFPESITTAGPKLMVGSFGDGTIWEADPRKGRAEVWLKPEKSGLRSVLGVYADERRHLLWVCSLPRDRDSPAARDTASAVLAFDLTSRQAVHRYPMPGGTAAVCNDFAVARDGTVYVAETVGGRILRLRKDGFGLEDWLTDQRLTGVDGIAIDRLGNLYVSSVTTGRFFRVSIARNGSAAGLIELTPSRKLDHPDGLRYAGRGLFLIAENGSGGGISVARVAHNAVVLRALPDGRPGTTSATAYNGRAWGVIAKLRFARDPKLTLEDPGPFSIYSIPLMSVLSD